MHSGSPARFEKFAHFLVAHLLFNFKLLLVVWTSMETSARKTATNRCNLIEPCQALLIDSWLVTFSFWLPARSCQNTFARVLSREPTKAAAGNLFGVQGHNEIGFAAFGARAEGGVSGIGRDVCKSRGRDIFRLAWTMFVSSAN